MLKAYCHTTSAATAATLFTVPANHELAVVSIEISGGPEGGDIILRRLSGETAVFSQTLAIDPADAVVLDHKMFFEAGTSLEAEATAAGMQIAVNASLDEV